MQIKSAIVTILLLLTVIAYTIHLFIEYCDFVSVSSPLTNIIWYKVKETIVDFKQPVTISKIIALPRSDGNGIYPGEEYELFYHSLEGWQSLGRHVATDYYLDYDNVPQSALYWLHNRTKGVEERIFTVTNEGEIRFW